MSYRNIRLPSRLAWLAITLLLSVSGAQAQTGNSDAETLERAQDLHLRGSYRAASELYTLIRGEFYQQDVAVGRALSLSAMGETDAAIDVLRQQLGSDDPADQPAVATRLAELLRDTGNSAEALDMLAAVIDGHNNPPLRSLVQYGDLLHFTGSRDEAAGFFQRAQARYDSGLVFESSDVGMVALANWKLGQFHQANALFSEAVRIDRNNLEAQVLWGDLFREKFNDADAEQSYNEALEINRRYAPALTGLANISATERNLQRALDINPGYVPAMVTYGKLLIRNDRHDEARRFLQRALDINPESLPALASLAGLAALYEDMDTYEELSAAVDSFSPANPGFHAIVADLFGNNYRFTEAVHHARKSIDADPQYWHGHTILGNNLVRLGEEDEGRYHLELSFDNDPFNVLTSNLLQVFDTLDGYATLETGHFRVNMSHRDALILWPYMAPLLEESWDHLVEKYQFEPEVPVIIQVFENTEDFAVRSVGLPDIGPLVGICFGKVVTLISPDTLSANWQEILWHELVHVWTLQMTNNRMPRWLSEGISVWEEGQFRPEWGRRQGLELVRAVEQQRLLPVGMLNEGFTGARSNSDLSFAYFQSYLVVDYIAEHFGFEKLLALVHEYAHIREESEMFANVFDVDMDEFDAGFRSWIDQRVEQINVYVHNEDAPDEGAGHGHGIRENNSAVMAELYNTASLRRHMRSRVENNSRDFQAHLQLGIILFKEENYREALQHLEAAHDILPDYTGYPSPPLIMSQIYDAMGDTERKLEQLAVLLEHQQHDYASAMVLAEHAYEQGDLERAGYYVDRALSINPYRLDVHRVAAGVASATGEIERAVREYEVIAELDINDPVAARTDLAEAYLRTERVDEARINILRALEIAPGYQRAQDVLLNAVEAREQGRTL